jgi:hypothetical protein
MIKNILTNWQSKKVFRDFSNSLLGKSLHKHTQEYFQNPRLSAFKEESKIKIIEDFSNQIIGICQTENPLLAMREALAGYSFEYIKFHILALNEKDKDIHYGKDCMDISGQLYKHIDKATDCQDDLRELKWKHPDIKNEELISFCNTRSVLYLYYVNGLNYVRLEFKDYDEEKDWLKPFLKSMAIYEEDNIRKHIGLPSLLSGKFDGLMHSTFANFVMSNCKNPYFEWEMACKNN